MKLSDPDLRRLMEDPALQAPRSSRGCPEQAELARVLARTATPAERQAFADHLVACGDCAEELRTANALASWSAEAADLLESRRGAAGRPGAAHAGGAAGRSGAGPRMFPGVVWIAAAASIIAAAGLVLVLRQTSPAALAERGAVELSRAIQPTDRAALPTPPERLEWAPMEGATSYEATIYDAESTPVWKSAPTRAPHVEVPADARARLTPGRNYLWRVVGRVGIDTRSSPVFEFSVAR